MIMFDVSMASALEPTDLATLCSSLEFLFKICKIADKESALFHASVCIRELIMWCFCLSKLRQNWILHCFTRCDSLVDVFAASAIDQARSKRYSKDCMKFFVLVFRNRKNFSWRSNVSVAFIPKKFCILLITVDMVSLFDKA